MENFAAAGPVAVFGGTGFLGREIVRRLVDDRVAVRVASRRRDRSWLDDPRGLVSFVEADVRTPAAVADAVSDASAVVNAVGLYVERGADTFQSVHVDGASNVAQAAMQAGVGRYVHLSGIGARADSSSAYVRARAEGEHRVRATFERATIVRPSALFGSGDALLSALDVMSRISPVIPLFGTGNTRLQPVYVGDVAKAVVNLLSRGSAGGRILELGGPRIYSYRELVSVVLAYRRRRRLLLPVPFGVWSALAKALAVMPSPPLTLDQVILMGSDNVVGDRVLTFADLGLTAQSMESLLSSCLPASPTVTQRQHL